MKYCLIAFLTLLFGMTPKLAESACVSALTKTALEQFIARPQSGFESFPQGGIKLAFHVQALAMSEARTIRPLVSAALRANALQREAVGYGLAHAANECSQRISRLPQLISDAVSSSGDRALIAAFSKYSEAAEELSLIEHDSDDAAGRMLEITSPQRVQSIENPVVPMGDPFATRSSTDSNLDQMRPIDQLPIYR